ncbi:MAG TPA: 2-oxoacid:ferredoxin oxidoreductase subunit beta [Ignavibacteria bacterium]|nr:2-oxoacid:ferredoxin oxidoreductase subunit beta [Ignavibacteria bacterium]
MEVKQETNTAVTYTAKDFASDQDVRWCPGCGDYSILAQVQRSLPALGIKKENLVFVAGIGCSSRFPYYMNTYGFHTIHGRATTVATGVKCANPDLSVWIVAGDGDLLSIGGNHFLHILRRNLDVNLLLFNNRIYGLTKGQYSPTSELGKITKSSPYGTIDNPLNPVSLALGANGTFIARSMDRDPKHLQDMIKRVSEHKGTSFLEIFQNCNIFNDGAFFLYTEKDTRPDNVIYLEHGKPLVFGANKDKGIKLDGFTPVIVDLNDGNSSINDLLIHDEKSRDLAFLLSSFADRPGYPAPVGVFLDIERPTYESQLYSQIESATAKKGKGDLDDILKGTTTWTIA